MRKLLRLLVTSSRPMFKLLLGALGIAPVSLLAQGQIASGIVSASGSGPYTYNLSFTDAAGASSPIGSVWYAWIPGAFYLPGIPTTASGPAGWTSVVSANSVQWIASSAANYIQPGQTLSGFSYQASFSPAELAAAPNSGVSVAYSGGLFSDAGNTFTVQPVPEPASWAIFALGLIFVLVRREPVPARAQE